MREAAREAEADFAEESRTKLAAWRAVAVNADMTVSDFERALLSVRNFIETTSWSQEERSKRERTEG